TDARLGERFRLIQCGNRRLDSCREVASREIRAGIRGRSRRTKKGRCSRSMKFAILAACTSLRAPPNIKIVQNASATTPGATSLTATFGATPTNNNLLIACAFTKTDAGMTGPTGFTRIDV